MRQNSGEGVVVVGPNARHDGEMKICFHFVHVCFRTPRNYLCRCYGRNKGRKKISVEKKKSLSQRRQFWTDFIVEFLCITIL